MSVNEGGEKVRYFSVIKGSYEGGEYDYSRLLETYLQRRLNEEEEGLLHNPEFLKGIKLIFDGGEMCREAGFPLFSYDYSDFYSQKPDVFQYEKELKEIVEMGFDKATAKEMLIKNGGDKQKTIFGCLSRN